jgi:hypothetical protein
LEHPGLEWSGNPRTESQKRRKKGQGDAGKIDVMKKADNQVMGPPSKD